MSDLRNEPEGIAVVIGRRKAAFLIVAEHPLHFRHDAATSILEHEFLAKRTATWRVAALTSPVARCRPAERGTKRGTSDAACSRVGATKRREGAARNERRPHQSARAETGRPRASGAA